MQRITITIEDDLLAEIDAAAEARGYQNRSEIIRDLARAGLQQDAEDADHRANASPRWSTSTTTPRGTFETAGAEFPRSSRPVAGDAARPSRRRYLHGGHGAERRERRGPALCRPHHRRTRRALRPRGDDPDSIRQEAEGAQARPSPR